ncbi:hypothetical protein [Brucella anthropi]|uniref:hypothetical protein n=1 Tax=Brucella anthropi TaxID=529 RepID=UPI001F3DD721|nr:hypothetical protein [Brucella anthropi]
MSKQGPLPPNLLQDKGNPPNASKMVRLRNGIVFVLIAGMLGATFLLRPFFMQTMALHPAAYVANGIGLIVGAAANLLLVAVFRKISAETYHSFMGISMIGWSVIGAVGGVALAAYGWTL